MICRALFVAAVLGYCSTASAADPITMFLLQMLSNKAIEAITESANSPSALTVTPGASKPSPPLSKEQELRKLIDESFAHLAQAQRDAVYDGLMKMLNDPQNASQRAQILAEFTFQANQYRDANRALANLSYTDKQAIATQARSEFDKLPPAKRAEIVQALEAGIPGLPRELGDLMLAEFRNGMSRTQ